MNRLFVLFIAFFFFNNCSLNENSGIWKNKNQNLLEKQNVKKIFADEKLDVSEFNKELKLDLSTLKSTNKIVYNKNNYGSQKYKGNLKKIGNFKFSKLEGINHINFKPIFLSNGIIFFDKKGSIIRYDNNQKVLWKKNHYSKSEKKQNPKLNFLLSDNKIFVADSIAKYYSINLDTGDLNWLNSNSYPFNSDIKNYKDKIFVIDFKNILRCYNIKDGSECWNLQTENSFIIPNSKYSLIVIDEIIIFSNSIGDITAVRADTGMIVWQLPTQNSNIINETHNFKISKLVSNGNSIFFSNNKNQFYSVDVKTGVINWINNINSNINPVVIGNLIFSISEEGYLYVIEKNKGNIIRITDLLSNYKPKKRKEIKPIGFVIGNKKLYLTISNGKILVVNLSKGEVANVEKVSGDLISEPFIFQNNLYVLRNGSIIKYN